MAANKAARLGEELVLPTLCLRNSDLFPFPGFGKPASTK